MPQPAQKYRVKVAPESLGLSKDFGVPRMLSAVAGTIATLEWPVPLAFWQSRQEHSGIESTGPSMLTSIAPQAQVVVAFVVGRWVVLIG